MYHTQILYLIEIKASLVPEQFMVYDNDPSDEVRKESVSQNEDNYKG